MTSAEDIQRQCSSLELLRRWKLGFPMFEMFWAVLIFGGIVVALLLPFVQWIRQLLG
jgi:hypothetical protein